MSKKSPTKSKSKRKGRNSFEDKVLKDVASKIVDFFYETEEYAYTLQRTYLADISIPKLKRVIEVKGHFPLEDRNKMEAVIRQNPGTKFFLLFQADNYLAKRSNSVKGKLNKVKKTKGKVTKKDKEKIYGRRKKYSDWCKDRGIEYAIGEKVPMEWLE